MKTRPEILLHPNIPKPLHGVNPRSIKGKEWWDIERQKAYASTDYHCLACGVYKSEADYHQWLEAHELYDYDYKKGRLTFIELVPLCHCCHNYIHSGRMQALVDKGEMEFDKMVFIRKRGDKIVKDNKLKRPKPPTKCAEWSKWRLIFDGKEYAPKFKNYAEWLNHFHPGGNWMPFDVDLIEVDMEF